MNFSGSPTLMSSTMASHPSLTQPWIHADPREWDNDPVPPGDFMKMFENQSENSHLVGRTSHGAPPVEELAPTPPARGNQNMEKEQSGRIDKRILWTQDEDLRVMNAWLKKSVDSVSGNHKRNEQYWGDVARTYNDTTPSHRRRNMKQVKDRWHKVNRWTNLFHCVWLKARRLNTSGWNDQMWIDEAHKWYVSDNEELKLGHFVLMNVWYAVRNEPKWVTYNDNLQNAHKRKGSDHGAEEDREEADPFDVTVKPRPMGTKAAKKAAHEAKVHSMSSSTEDADVTILKEAQANRLKVLEVQ
ncbi:hypothetical protein PVAP13_8KG275900 [Panicum virgatum]|uniref:Myb-like domain-containing protein n=2 Tax=Panicum virgatum TaxID=38727 RepID=A0A8T0PPD4_PANVG|nr:hypothetical protein PVAP13_8KG275900 [Panicum virgatum]